MCGSWQNKSVRCERRQHGTCIILSTFCVHVGEVLAISVATNSGYYLVNSTPNVANLHANIRILCQVLTALNLC
jgi:hypothetical protein